MNDKLRVTLDNADMQAAPKALLRAARRAREIARQTELDPDSPEVPALDET